MNNCSSTYKHEKLSASMANMQFSFSNILWILSDMLQFSAEIKSN